MRRSSRSPLWASFGETLNRTPVATSSGEGATVPFVSISISRPAARSSRDAEEPGAAG